MTREDFLELCDVAPEAAADEYEKLRKAAAGAVTRIGNGWHSSHDHGAFWELGQLLEGDDEMKGER